MAPESFRIYVIVVELNFYLGYSSPPQRYLLPRKYKKFSSTDLAEGGNLVENNFFSKFHYSRKNWRHTDKKKYYSRDAVDRFPWLLTDPITSDIELCSMAKRYQLHSHAPQTIRSYQLPNRLFIVYTTD